MSNRYRNIVVIGAGGHSKVVIATARAAGLNVVGIYDDNPILQGSLVLDVPVIGLLRDIRCDDIESAILAIGTNSVRCRLASELKGIRWCTIIHPTALVHESVRIGSGCVIFAGSVIQPDVIIGEHVIVNTCASLDHDCQIGDFAHVAPGVRLAGNVHVDDGVFFGIGSCAIPNISIGAWSAIGAGAAVTGNIDEGVLAVGVPARVIKNLDEK